MEPSGAVWWRRIRAHEMPHGWVYLVAAGLILFKFWLLVSLALTAYGYNIHDDRLFMNGANALLNGRWMGQPYTNLTLAKGPFYPIFVAGSFLLGVPLLWAQRLLYTFACGFFAHCLGSWLPSRLWRLILFAVLLFNPMSDSEGPANRVIREGIYPSLTLLVIGCLLGLIAHLDDEIRRKRNLYAIGLGLCFSAFWLTREEGVWIVPALVLILPLAFVGRGPLGWSRWRLRLQAAGIGAIAAALPFGAVVLLNGHRYGIYVTTEFQAGWFNSALGALQRVKPASWRAYVSVPREVRERVYTVSPKFRELQPFLEEGIGKGWVGLTCTMHASYGICDDMDIGYFMWAFRDAVADAGYYRRGGRAVAEYCTALTAEVNSACDSGALDCLPRRDTLMVPWRSEYVPAMRALLLEGVHILAGFSHFQPIPNASGGSPESLRIFQDLTRSPLASPPGRILVDGWAFSPHGELSITVQNPDSTPADFSARRVNRPDVVAYLKSHGVFAPWALHSGFSLSTSCQKDCLLEMRDPSGVVKVLSIDPDRRGKGDPGVLLFVDTVRPENQLPNQSAWDVPRRNILISIGYAFKRFMPLLTALALAFWGWGGVLSVRARRIAPLHLIAIAMLSSAVFRIFLLALISATAFPAMHGLYMCAAHPLLLGFVILALADAARWCSWPTGETDSKPEGA